MGLGNMALHKGVWIPAGMACTKQQVGAHEIRGKVLGIVGYGHIGSQLSVLADSMGKIACKRSGMQIIFYDILRIMPLGNTRIDLLFNRHS